jgi:hypothetical protein
LKVATCPFGASLKAAHFSTNSRTVLKGMNSARRLRSKSAHLGVVPEGGYFPSAYLPAAQRSLAIA